MGVPFLVSRMRPIHVQGASRVHTASFPRQERSREWIRCNLAAYPRTQCFVAESDGQIIGYAIWLQKSGFRSEAVLELDQIAVAPDHRNKGVGVALINLSLVEIEVYLNECGQKLKAILISTRHDNKAVRLYRRTVGAEIVATVPGLYSADEVILLAKR